MDRWWLTDDLRTYSPGLLVTLSAKLGSTQGTITSAAIGKLPVIINSNKIAQWHFESQRDKTRSD